jgi:hypothetical protein
MIAKKKTTKKKSIIEAAIEAATTTEPDFCEIIKDKPVAQSSHVANRYDLTPRNFIERVGQRFALGDIKYPPFNYRNGLTDRKFIIERINHLQEHFYAYMWPRNNDEWNDDNLAAIGWSIAFLMEVEDDPIGRGILEEIRSNRGMIGSRIKE